MMEQRALLCSCMPSTPAVSDTDHDVALIPCLQAQQMIADNMGLALAVSLSYACRNDPRARQLLPLLAFPLLATGDLCSIYRELKSIHLRNLNKERAEIVAEMWLEAGRIPSAAEVPAKFLLFPCPLSTTPSPAPCPPHCRSSTTSAANLSPIIHLFNNTFG